MPQSIDDIPTGKKTSVQGVPLHTENNKTITEAQLERLRDNLKEIKDRKDQGAIYFFRPLASQMQFLKAQGTNKISGFFAGNRTGKSTTGAVSVVAAMIDKHPFWTIETPPSRRLIWCVSLDFTTARRTTIQKVIEYAPTDMVARWYEQDKILKFKHGGEIQFRSAEVGREHFQGAEIDCCWMDEEPPEDVFQECMARTVDRRGKILLTMTPLKGMTWVYDRIWMACPENGGEDDRIRVIQSDVHENSHLPKDEVLAWEASMSEEERQMRISGKFISLEGFIWAKEIEDSHAILDHPYPIDTYWRKCRAIDPGARNPAACVWMAVDPAGCIYVYDYFQAAGKATKDFAQEIIKRSGGYPDAWKGMTLIDPSAAQWKIDLLDHGIYCEDADNDVFAGIMRVKGLFHAGKLRIYPHCKQLIKDCKRYQWDPASKRGNKDGPEKPKKRDDHGPDALRYACMALRGVKAVAPHPDANPRSFEWWDRKLKLDGMKARKHGSLAWQKRMNHKYRRNRGFN